MSYNYIIIKWYLIIVYYAKIDKNNIWLKKKNIIEIIPNYDFLRFLFFCFSVISVHLSTIFSIWTFEKCSFQRAKVRNKNGCKVYRHENKMNRRGTGVKRSRIVWYKRSVFQKEKNRRKKFWEKKKSVGYVFCVMLSDVIKFVLRHFLGFLTGFCVLYGKLLGWVKENGLEWFKMAFVVFAL